MDTLVKSKSMLTEECELRPFLERRGVRVTETDLGERIQQLDDQPPGHIIDPAIHKTTHDVAILFSQKYGSDPKNEDAAYLAAAMRENTRPDILNAPAGMTGANFVVAETGAIVVATNEGNADLSAHTPALHICSVRDRKDHSYDGKPCGLHSATRPERHRRGDNTAHFDVPRTAQRSGHARHPGR
jgi:L-lactate dehydrogenase complex protein LldF